MHVVDVMEETLRLAKRIGYCIRQEWLGGSGCGGCEIHGRKFLFLDLSLGPDEQLDLVLDTLKNDPDLLEADIPAKLRPLLSAASHAKRGAGPTVPGPTVSVSQNQFTPPSGTAPAENTPAQNTPNVPDAVELALRRFTADGLRQNRKTA